MPQMRCGYHGMRGIMSISDHMMIHGVRCRQIRPVASAIACQMFRWLTTIAGCAAQKKAKHHLQRTRSLMRQKPVGQSSRIMGPTSSRDTGAFYRMDYVFRRSCGTLSFYNSILKLGKVIHSIIHPLNLYSFCCAFCWFFFSHSHGLQLGCRFCLKHSVFIRSPSEKNLKAQCDDVH